MRLFPLLIALLSLAACDSPTDVDTSTTYQGVSVSAKGDATLTVENGALVVSGLTGTRSGGFALAGAPTQVDVEIDPLTLAAGQRFGVTVNDASGNPALTLFNEGTGQGRFDFSFEFSDTFNAQQALVFYKSGGAAGDIVMAGYIPLGSFRGGRVMAASTAGSGSGSTGSTHVIRENGRYVVVSDSDAGDARTAGCAGFLVDLPLNFLPFDDFFVDGPICTDWVEVEPFQAQGPAPTGEVSVTGRGVGSFRVTSLVSR